MSRRPVVHLLRGMDGWEEREAMYHVKQRKIHAAREIERRRHELRADAGSI